MFSLNSSFHAILQIYLEISYFIYDAFKIPYDFVIGIFILLSLITILHLINPIQQHKSLTKTIAYSILSVNFILISGSPFFTDISPTKTNTFIGHKLNTKKIKTTEIVIPRNKVLKYSNVSDTLTYVNSKGIIQKQQFHIDAYKLISKKDSPKIKFTKSIYKYNTSYRNIKTFIIDTHNKTESFGDGQPQNHFDKSTQTWIDISNVTMYVSKSDYDKYAE